MSPSFKTFITLEEREDLKIASLNKLQNLFSNAFNKISLTHPMVLLYFLIVKLTPKKEKILQGSLKENRSSKRACELLMKKSL